MEQSSLESQFRGCAKTPILTVGAIQGVVPDVYSSRLAIYQRLSSSECPLFVYAIISQGHASVWCYGFPAHLSILCTNTINTTHLCPFWYLFFCFCFLVILALFFVLFLCSRWRFVGVPVIYSCVQHTTYRISDRVYYWVWFEARWVNVKKKHTHTQPNVSEGLEKNLNASLYKPSEHAPNQGGEILQTLR